MTTSTMIEKKVFCSFCGKALFTVTFETYDKCHIQDVTLNGGCDTCNRGTTVAWNVHELDAERERKKAAAIARAKELVQESMASV